MKEELLYTILREYKEGLRKIFGDSLEQVLLYGSYARAEARDDSDVDVLCIINKPFKYGELIRKTSELTSNISLKYDVSISRAFALSSDYRKLNLPFYINTRREAIAV